MEEKPQSKKEKMYARNTIEKKLERLGYKIQYKYDAGKTCVVQGHRESWIGKGNTEEDSFNCVVSKMFPSTAAMKLLQGEPSRNKSFNSHTKARVGTSQTSCSVKECIQRLNNIEEEIEETLDDLALMTTLYQRLHAAEWIMKARALEQMHPDNEDVEEGVHQIARRLTTILKMFWPGSVRGLKQWASPVQSLEGLVETDKMVQYWEDAASVTQDYLIRLEDTYDDDFGWSDPDYCSPPPKDSNKVQEEAKNIIEDILGSIEDLPDTKRGTVSRRHIANNMGDLVYAAKLLRWCRTTTDNPNAWGRMMGLLRWAARSVRDEAVELKTILADDYVPETSWATVIQESQP